MGLCMIIRGGKRPLRGCLAKDKHYHKTGRDFATSVTRGAFVKAQESRLLSKRWVSFRYVTLKFFMALPLSPFQKPLLNPKESKNVPPKMSLQKCPSKNVPLRG